MAQRKKRASRNVLYDEPADSRTAPWQRPQTDDEGGVIYVNEDTLGDDAYMMTDGKKVSLEPGHYRFWTTQPCKGIIEAWNRSILHRRGGPAIEITAPRNLWSFNIWYLDGKLHRDGGPARLEYDNRGGC